MSHKQVLIIFLTILLAACKEKELPQEPVIPAPPAPVFYVRGMLNGAPFNINGGVDNYYMHSSFTKDTSGIHEFIGELKPYSCVSNCANSIKVIFRDQQPKPGNVDSVLLNSYYSFASIAGAASRYNVHFNSKLPGSGSVKNFLSWDFGDGTTSKDNNPTHMYKRPGEYTVCMIVKGSNTSCDGSICDKVRIGNIGPRSEAKFTFKAEQNNVVSFTANPKGTRPFILQWDLGDGNQSTSESFTHTYSKPGVYQVSLTVIDADSLSDTEYANVATKNWNDCVASFTWAPSSVPNPKNLSNVIIEWTDDKGNTYSSYNANQPELSTFRVVKVENFITNEQGQKTKKIHMRVNCVLYRGSSSIELKNAALVFAVAHP